MPTGLSLLLAPVVAGFVMQILGNRLEDHLDSTRATSPFRGGALFASLMARIRRGFEIRLSLDKESCLTYAG